MVIRFSSVISKFLTCN